LTGAADFNTDGKPDYLLYSAQPSNSDLVYEQQHLCRRRVWTYSASGLELGRALTIKHTF
jgi:hypothetical protein